MKRLSIFRRTRAIEVLTPEDFQPPSPHAQARFDALPDDDPWKAGLRHAEHQTPRGCRDCGPMCECGRRICPAFGPEPSDDDNTCCECAAEERKQ